MTQEILVPSRFTPSLIVRMASWLGELTMAKAALVASLLGFSAALALPPLHFLPILPIAFTGLIWLLDGTSSKYRAFALGWWFGLGHFSFGFYWIAHALLIDPWRHGWMIPFAILGLAAGMALFTAFATWCAWRMGNKGWQRIVTLAASWVIAEWLRSWVLTGFPWNLLGSIWAASEPMLQGAAIAGVLGLSFITILAASSLAVTAYGYKKRYIWIMPSLAFGVLGALFVGGETRLSSATTDFFPDIALRIVQANIPQDGKWQENKRERNLERHIALSLSPGFESRTHVIWPESAASYYLANDAVHRTMASLAAPRNGLLITGALRMTALGIEPFQIWNSLHALDASGRIQATYDKAHLVPFGEYVPWRDFLPLRKLTAGNVDFSSGPGIQTLTAPNTPPFSPLICYEVIFSGHVVTNPRPDWILNVTNDGWFGLSFGPYQHFTAARLRAVEEGLPLVRAANTGISAVIDPYGRIIYSISLGKEGILDSPLPKPLPPTIFSIIGNTPLISISFVIILVARFCRQQSLNVA